MHLLRTGQTDCPFDDTAIIILKKPAHVKKKIPPDMRFFHGKNQHCKHRCDWQTKRKSHHTFFYPFFSYFCIMPNKYTWRSHHTTQPKKQQNFIFLYKTKTHIKQKKSIFFYFFCLFLKHGTFEDFFYSMLGIGKNTKGLDAIPTEMSRPAYRCDLYSIQNHLVRQRLFANYQKTDHLRFDSAVSASLHKFYQNIKNG